MTHQKLAFCFGGIGSQWESMGSGLLEYPAFHRTIEACDDCFKPYAGWSIKEELQKKKEASRIHDPFISQPCICALEIALVELFKEWGIQPDAVIGHSLAEMPAAYAADILSLEDIFKIIWHACLLGQNAEGIGVMMHVSLPLRQVIKIIGKYKDNIFVAAYNSPKSTVIAGESQDIRKIADILGQQQVFHRILNTSVPFHTPMIAPYTQTFYKGIRDIEVNPMSIPVYSSFSGELAKARKDYNAQYWATYIQKTVRFSPGIETTLRNEYPIFLELSPHPVLTGAINEVIEYNGNPKGVTIQGLKRGENEKETLMTSIAHLVQSGYPVQWDRFSHEDADHIRNFADILDQEAQRDQDMVSHISGPPGKERRKHLTEVVKASVSEVLQQEMTIPDNKQVSFFDMGMNSLKALRVVKRLSSRLQIQLPSTLLFEYPNFQELLDQVEILLSSQLSSSDARPCETEKQTCAEESFHVFNYIDIQENPLFKELSHCHFLRVTHQKDRKLEIQGGEFIDFASCNYLGLDYHPEVMAAIPRLIEKWGVHPSWTRLVASPDPYFELETRLAEFLKAPSTVVFPSISMMNMGVLPVLAGPDGALICDVMAHNTIQEGCQLASAKGIPCAHFKHNDLDDLERHLKRYRNRSPVIVTTDGVYSTSAEYLDLPAYSELVKKYNAFLYIDDAHGFGIIGENPDSDMPYGYKGNGIVNYYGMDYEKDHLIYISGLSKAFSTFAAFITCFDEQMEEKIRLASTLVFSGPIPVACLASALTGIKINEKEGNKLRLKLYHLSERLVSGARSLGFKVDNNGGFPVVFVVTGKPDQTIKAAKIIWSHGLVITPGIFPAVPYNRGGLRFTITALNTESEIDKAILALEEVRDKCRIPTIH